MNDQEIELAIKNAEMAYMTGLITALQFLEIMRKLLK